MVRASARSARATGRVALGAAALGLSVTAWCVTLTVGKGAPIETIAEAARLAKDGDTIDILPGEYHADVAVWLQKRLTIRGVGETPVLKADVRSAEGKAIWVLRNGEFVIENIAFEGARVDDRNGAGVRFERGSLTLRRCRFGDNENGVYLVNNTLLSDRREGAWFLRVASERLPTDTDIVAVNNLTAGLGVFTLGARGTFERNFPLVAAALGDPATLDFRLGAHSLLRGFGAAPPVVDGRSLAPVAEFRLPIGTTPLPPRHAWLPGAFQTTDPLR
ncbi:MAG TPA: hypothetical protein VFI50_13355 [Casimicrobiaceae bacterium]|nr:hypothetical protein [Casimicrobiaceae bacterium]